MYVCSVSLSVSVSLQEVLLDLFALNLHIEPKRMNRFVHDARGFVNALVQASVDLFALLVIGLAVVVDHDLDGVFETQFHQTFGHGRGVVHRWGAIHFDQPAIEVLVNHDVVAEKLVWLALLGIKRVLDGLQAVDHDVFYLFAQVLLPDIIPVLLLKVVLEILQTPHVALDFELRLAGAVLGHGVVAQMRIIVVKSFQVEIRGWKPYVRLRVHPNRQGVPVGHQHPLSQIKLARLYDQTGLDVLLDDIRLLQLLSHVHDLDQAVLQTNAASSRAAGRLHNPYVFLAIDSELGELALQLIDQLQHSLEFGKFRANFPVFLRLFVQVCFWVVLVRIVALDSVLVVAVFSDVFFGSFFLLFLWGSFDRSDVVFLEPFLVLFHRK